MRKSKFELVTCSCGCKKKYPKSKTGHVKVEILERNFKKDILSIKRLSDNRIFGVGQTIRRISETGKKYNSVIIDSILQHSIGGPHNIIIHCSVINRYEFKDRGGVIIDNMSFQDNASSPNRLRYIY